VKIFFTTRHKEYKVFSLACGRVGFVFVAKNLRRLRQLPKLKERKYAPFVVDSAPHAVRL
jgi:hypothetical protein